MTFSAKVYKRCFQAGFYAGDAAFEDAGLFLHAGTVFNIQIVKLLAIDEGNTQFFFLRGIN